MKEQASALRAFAKGGARYSPPAAIGSAAPTLKSVEKKPSSRIPPPAFPFRSAPAHFCFPCESYSRESTHANQRVFITFSTKRKNRAPPTDERDRSLRFV